MILTKTVLVKWSANTKRYYTEKGYTFTNYGDEFEVKVEDLTPANLSIILCKCDFCKEEKEIRYKNYRRTEFRGKYKCTNCKRYINNTLFGMNRKVNERFKGAMKER